MTEYVILVDQNDCETGVSEKMDAHHKALLHRAFSVFIFDSRHKMLMQQRALQKYHSGGKWTNACCGHPRPGETTEAAAQRRLKEEMGISCNLQKQFSFTYKASLDNGFTEHEIDHVFFGVFEGNPHPDPNEAMAYKWVYMEELVLDMQHNGHAYTEWFKICIKQVIEKMNIR